MAGNNTVSPTDQVEFWDPETLPTTNNPPHHKGQEKSQKNAFETNKQYTENKKEIGSKGDEGPTRYGDWEKNGRCVDF